jgi:DNA-binding MarR family transcriptional regulator
MFELADSIGYLLNRAAAQVRVRLEQKLAPHGITVQQWAVLFVCFKTGATTPTALARTVGIDGAAVTRLLDRMESKGLLRRMANPANRRSLTVEIAARGRALAPKLPPLAQQVLDEALAGFSAAEKEQLRTLLRHIVDAGARAEGSDEPGQGEAAGRPRPLPAKSKRRNT